MLSEALGTRTKQLYCHYWNHFHTFCVERGISSNLPVSEISLVNFLSELITKGYKLSTAASHASALAYINKMFGYKDFSGSFLVNQFFKGAKNIASSQQSDTRLPMSPELLQRLIEALPQVITALYDRVLFGTMCIFAFHGFLRIGEICAKSKTSASVIQFSDVRLVQSGQSAEAVEIHMRTFKHSKNAVTLLLPKRPGSLLCPVAAARLYLSLAKQCTGPFFQHLNHTPVTYAFFSRHLQLVTTFLGLNPRLYTSHSFCIGAATYAASKGMSDDMIKRLGRWNSNAFQNYIRMPELKLTE